MSVPGTSAEVIKCKVCYHNISSTKGIQFFMGVCVQEGQLHALLEYIEGGSLEQLLANQEIILTAAMKIRLALGIARGMSYVHDAGIFHRDLTSKNVLIRNLPDGQFDAVVGDFGLAAKIPDKKKKTRLDTVGSPYWVSPECLKGQWYDQTSDVFSFGIIQCEIIARIEADPDIMPRTDSFGLDYLAFVELCPMDTPPVFLRLAFYCCIYDSKSRPTFHEAAKKLALLLEKQTNMNNCSSPLSSLELNGSPIGSDLDTPTPDNLLQLSLAAKCSAAKNLSQLPLLNENGFNFMLGSSDELDVSIEPKCSKVLKQLEAAEVLAQQHRRSLSENIIHFPLHTTPSDKARCHQMQRQRSSTHSPTPPPKGSVQNQSPPAEKQLLIETVKTTPINAVLTLRKVAETMCLKDVQYKPIRTDENGVKSNPFTAMAQLRGVKKILGANPKTYAAGVGDLFSSCFEMSAPFFKEALQKAAGLTGEETGAILADLKSNKISATNSHAPKSLPTSPQLSRKFSVIDLKLSPTLPACMQSSEDAIAVATEDEDNCDECASDVEQDADGGGNCADAESSSDDSAERSAPGSNTNTAAAPTSRKYRANSLYAHPLFRSTGGNVLKNEDIINTLLASAVNSNVVAGNVVGVQVDDSNSSDEGEKEAGIKSRSCVSTPVVPNTTSANPTTSLATPASVSSCTDFEIKPYDYMPVKSTLQRRDSIESGFYSCFNEESNAAINPTYKQFNPSSLTLNCAGNCCFEQLKAQLLQDAVAPEEINDKLASLCRCCYYSNASSAATGQQTLHNESLSSSSSVLLIDDGIGSTTSSGVSLSNAMALRSFDDLELTDATRPHRRYTCHHHLLHGGMPGVVNNASTQHMMNDQNATTTNASNSSMDMGLINRLALDHEIHSLMQRSPFAANHLLYCKNRTSSIYTDSSDDISSLAGSDSLLWDERSFTVIPNTRSAQIAKIVEYFERKRQVPEHTPPLHRNCGTVGNNNASSSVAAAVAASALNPSYLSYETRRYTDFKRHAALNSDYETFCFDLDKKPTQQRLMVCEGAVKSKLQIFDKMKQQQQLQQLQQQQQQQQIQLQTHELRPPPQLAQHNKQSTATTKALNTTQSSAG